MTFAPADDRPWWAFSLISETPNDTDLGEYCGHARFLHDAEGNCLIDHREVAVGGDEGIDKEDPKNPKQVTLPATGVYKREACFCPGETVFYVAGLPPGFNWDSLELTQWRDPEAKKTSNGNYRWYIS